MSDAPEAERLGSPPTRALSSQRYAGLQPAYRPGERGGPGGRSLAVGRALSLARRWSPHAVQLCGKTIVDESAPLSLRLRAAETILAVAVPKATPDRASVLRELLEITFVDAADPPTLAAKAVELSQTDQQMDHERGEERPRDPVQSADVVPGAMTDLDGLAPPSVAANDDQSGQ